MTTRSIIIATGSYLPARRVSNDDLAKTLDTSDAWIRERTGITVRHIAAEGEFTSHMATHAARDALKNARLKADAIDGIVVGTSTPDTTMPSVACKVQAALGTRGAALDVGAACTGFISALSVARGWLMTGVATRVLVIGAENMSRIVDWNDRSTCILFGDGAGAVVLEAHSVVPPPLGGRLGGGLSHGEASDHRAPLLISPRKGEELRGIRAITLDAQGEFGDILCTNGGVSSTQTAGVLSMQGQEVFRHGVEKMAAITTETLKKSGHEVADVDWLVGHQANARMLKMIARSLKIPDSKCIVTVDIHANTSAASIPLALDAAVSQGKIKVGDIVAMPALGAGLTWGCAVISW